MDIKGRLFRADGAAEDEILINQNTRGIAASPSVAFGPGDRLAAAWLAEGDHADFEIAARLFTIAP